ncbi:transcription factor A, mitochondrial [Wyeomyia smithii]|uniref:transcription factor A, mitochondrial n=1 Tax=Wyeomyia smithii TaxID=174621 RepID=UPI0024681D75|nr:transcription factor A, mitochondrial [Wyeomyia smithii]
MQAFGLGRSFLSSTLFVTKRPVASLHYQQRCGIQISTNLLCPASKESTLPERPKRPCNPFIKYAQSVRTSLMAKNPVATPREITKLAAVQWNQLDTAEKSKLAEAFKEEQAVWLQQNAKYLNQLTDQQKDDIRQDRLKKLEEKSRREQRKRIKELGKPKRPLNGFLLYVLEQRPKNLNREENSAYLKSMGERWAKMSEAEKEPYNRRAADGLAKYHNEVKQWEEKMSAENNMDVIRRKNVIITEKKETKKVTRQ